MSNKNPGSAILEKYAFLFLAALISLCYTSLRFTLNVEYSGATWQQLYDLSAPIPFGNRILIPILSRPLVRLGYSVREAFFFWEIISSMGLIISTRAVLRKFVTPFQADAGAILFFYLLPLSFLLRFEWPIFYPHDTPAMLFVMTGLLLSISQRWKLLLLLVFISTLNRESAILLSVNYFLVNIDRVGIRKLLGQTIVLLTAYALVRVLVGILVADNPRPYSGSMAFTLGDGWRVNNNLSWLLSSTNSLRLLATLGFLPVYWLLLEGRIPMRLRLIGVAGSVYFAQLCFIGNLYEPRIFGELLVILFVPIFIAMTSKFINIKEKIDLDGVKEHNHRILSELLKKYSTWTVLIISFFALFLLNKLGPHY